MTTRIDLGSITSPRCSNNRSTPGAFHGRLPKRAIRQAVEQREVITTGQLPVGSRATLWECFESC